MVVGGDDLCVSAFLFFAAPCTVSALYMYYRVLLLGSNVLPVANLAGLNLWRHVQGFSIC